MKKAPAAAALVAALATPTSSGAIMFEVGAPINSCEVSNHLYPSALATDVISPETPSNVINCVREQVAACQDVQVSDPVHVAAPGRRLPYRGYFYARPRTPEAQACMTQEVRSVRSRVSNSLRIRSGIDRPNGRRIVIVDYRPEPKHNRSKARGRN